MTFEQRANRETSSILNYLIENIKYDKNTGYLWWIVSGSGRYLNKPAGKITTVGYVQVIVKGKQYAGHRIAWALHHGNWPSQHIDHINGIKNDNRLINLRDVSHSVNMLNIHNAYGEIPYVGVSRNGKGFRAQACVNGVRKHIGTYRTPEEALDARKIYLSNLGIS